MTLKEKLELIKEDILMLRYVGGKMGKWELTMYNLEGRSFKDKDLEVVIDKAVEFVQDNFEKSMRQ